MIYSSVYLHTFIYIYSISINISWFSLWLVAVSHSFKSWHAGLKIHSNAGKLLRSPTFLYKTSHRQKTCDSDPKKGEDRRLKQHKHQEINNMYLSLCTVVRRHSSFFQRIRGIYIYMAGVQNSRSKGSYKVGPIGIAKLILHLRYEAGPIGNHAVPKLGASTALAWR